MIGEAQVESWQDLSKFGNSPQYYLPPPRQTVASNMEPKTSRNYRWANFENWKFKNWKLPQNIICHPLDWPLRCTRLVKIVQLVCFPDYNDGQRQIPPRTKFNQSLFSCFMMILFTSLIIRFLSSVCLFTFLFSACTRARDQQRPTAQLYLTPPNITVVGIGKF